MPELNGKERGSQKQDEVASECRAWLAHPRHRAKAPWAARSEAHPMSIPIIAERSLHKQASDAVMRKGGVGLAISKNVEWGLQYLDTLECGAWLAQPGKRFVACGVRLAQPDRQELGPLQIHLRHAT